ncbi:MAG TPA: hypothetical protein VFJ58_08960 [Armatimonadota bacterium]|nr:hypothetical protein [Armatimonadota bacterium]
MISIQTTGHVGSDGTLALHEPTPLRNVDVDVLVVLQPTGASDADMSPEESGWPAGFFAETYGSCADDPIERPPQGAPDLRDPFA